MELTCNTSCPQVTGDSLRTAKKDEESKVREATISYVCATIAQSCGGTFQRSPLAFMLSIPCQVRRAGAEETSAPVAAIIREEGADGGDSVGAGSFLTNARSSPGASPTDARAVDILKQAQVALDDKIRQSADVQERFRRKRVCAIVTDAVLEEVITAAITRMGLGAGLTVLHELQRGNYVPVAMVTFVTTYSLCVELRQRQYHGMIVLFSGSANYLDDAQFASVDYCMPLPCSDQHIGRFMDWLVEVHAKQEAIKAEVAATSATAAAARRQRATAGHQTARSEASFSVQSGTKTRPIGPDSLPLLVSPHYVVKSVIRAIRSTAASIQHAILSKDNFFLAVRLPPGTLESYTKWKLLNPSGSVYHHSTEITIVMFARFLISAILENTVVKHNRAPMALAMIACLMTMLRCISYRYILKPLGWHMYKYWLIPAALIGGYYVYVILQRTNYPAIRDMTLAEFQDTDFTPGRTGTHLLYGQIQSGTTARLYALYLTHPINTMLFILIFIRNSQTLWAVMRNIASIQMCEYIQLLLVQMTALNLVYQIHLENTYRREFIAAYHHILARAFLDQCLEICQQDIRKPLEYLLARKGDLMKVLQHAAQSRVLTVDRALMEKLEPLQVSHALLSEMVNELTYHPLLTSAENGSVRYSAEQVHLSHCVASLVAAFSSSLDDHHVQVVAEVDAQLAVVRVDWKMLSLVLTNLISAALRNIREYCIETPRRRDLLNTVFIKFTAIECSKNVPFVSPRLMLVNVCDSSSAASRVGRSAPPSDGKSSAPALAKAQDGSSDREMFRYGRGLCERLVRRVAVDSVRSVYQTLYSAESELQTVQRFTFPYHLCSQTHKAQDFLHGETSLPYLTIRVQPSTLLSAYTRIVRPCAPTQMNRHGLVFREPGEKRIVLLTSVDPKLRPGTMGLIARLQSGGWKCVIKYVLRVPSLASIGAADCVLIDQQLELQENVNICDTVLKLRVCGFSGIIAVALKEGLRKTDAIKEELSRSAVDADLIFTGLVTDMNIQSMTVALEKKCIAQALNKSEAYGERAARERERSVPQPGI
jgi:signal transduction histidine kinase